MDYIVRNIAPALDNALRARAAKTGTSLDKVAIEAMRRGLGLSHRELCVRDLDGLTEKWVEDPSFDEAIADQDRIDPQLWQ